MIKLLFYKLFIFILIIIIIYIIIIIIIIILSNLQLKGRIIIKKGLKRADWFTAADFFLHNKIQSILNKTAK